MRRTVDFYFDFVSPASYLAYTQLPVICECHGAELNCVPILLGGLMKATGNSPPMTVPAKGRYLMMDLQRHAEHYGVGFTPNPAFPFNTLPLLRMAAGLKAREPQLLSTFIDKVFQAIWVDGKNLEDLEIVRRCLEDAGIDTQPLFAMAADPRCKAAVAAGTQEAEERGAFGAPTMYLDGQMFFGQDRLEFLERALQMC